MITKMASSVVEPLSAISTQPSKIVTNVGQTITVHITSTAPVEYVSYHLEDLNFKQLTKSSGLLPGTALSVTFTQPGTYFLVISGYTKDKNYISTVYVPVHVIGNSNTLSDKTLFMLFIGMAVLTALILK